MLLNIDPRLCFLRTGILLRTSRGQLPWISVVPRKGRQYSCLSIDIDSCTFSCQLEGHQEPPGTLEEY